MEKCVKILKKLENELAKEIEPEIKQIAVKFEKVIQKLQINNENERLYAVEFLLNRLIDITKLSAFLEIWTKKKNEDLSI